MKLRHTTQLDGAVSKAVINLDNSLLAVVCDDLIIRLYDIDTKNVVRWFIGHINEVIDLVWIRHQDRGIYSFLLFACRPKKGGFSFLFGGNMRKNQAKVMATEFSLNFLKSKTGLILVVSCFYKFLVGSILYFLAPVGRIPMFFKK